MVRICIYRSDHPSNDKQGGVYVYLKSSLPIQMLSISMLHECINFEITNDSKLCNLICLCRSPSQNMEKFETFLENLELNLEFIFNKNPYLSVVLVTLMLNHLTGIKAIRPQSAGHLNMRS